MAEGLNPSGSMLPGKSPASCLWIGGGLAESDSVTPLLAGMAREWPYPETSHRLFTTSKQFGTFPGETYYVESKGQIIPERFRDCLIAAFEEGVFDDAEFIVTATGYAATLAFFMSIDRQRFRMRPTAAVFPAVEKRGEAVEMQIDENVHFWRLVADERASAIVLDNDEEERYARKWLHRADATSQGRAIYRMNWYQYDPSPWIEPELHTSPAEVMWSGRWNHDKNPLMMCSVFTFLKIAGVPCKAYVYASSSQNKQAALRMSKTAGFELAMDLPGDQYVQEASLAKVLLITSTSEAFPIGYIEMMERGVVPVYHARPWNATHLGTDWPLRFSTAGEGIEMVRQVLAEYPKWAALTRERLQQRYSASRNFGEIVVSMWERYLSTGMENPVGPTWHLGRKDRIGLAEKRGDG